MFSFAIGGLQRGGDEADVSTCRDAAAEPPLYKQVVPDTLVEDISEPLGVRGQSPRAIAACQLKRSEAKTKLAWFFRASAESAKQTHVQAMLRHTAVTLGGFAYWRLFARYQGKCLEALALIPITPPLQNQTSGYDGL